MALVFYCTHLCYMVGNEPSGLQQEKLGLKEYTT